MMAWVTPDDPPGEPVCIKVYCPSGTEYFAALRGAMLLLCDAFNWEQVGTQTPQTVSEAFLEALFLTLDWLPCMPVGSVIMGGWSSIPDGFLECNGASYATGDYPELFAAIGYQFGGSGSNFSVPNLSGKFPRGAGGGLSAGDTGGENSVTLTVAQMPSHAHPIPASIIPGGGAGALPVYGYNALALLQTQNTGGGGSHNNIPEYQVLKYAIAYR